MSRYLMVHAGAEEGGTWSSRALSNPLGLLSGVHGFFSRCVKDFAADRNTRSQKFYRIINEVPTILMIGIVILVVVKPF